MWFCSYLKKEKFLAYTCHKTTTLLCRLHFNDGQQLLIRSLGAKSTKGIAFDVNLTYLHFSETRGFLDNYINSDYSTYIRTRRVTKI